MPAELNRTLDILIRYPPATLNRLNRRTSGDFTDMRQSELITKTLHDEDAEYMRQSKNIELDDELFGGKSRRRKNRKSRKTKRNTKRCKSRRRR